MKLFTDSVFWLNFAEGVFRILLFVAYVWLISFMGEIKRVFQFHGAEHKTIHCFENGLELTPANCRQFPTLHPRCGTSFLMFVFIIAFALHFLLGWPTLWLRIVTRLLLLPVIAGLSYELLKWAEFRSRMPGHRRFRQGCKIYQKMRCVQHSSPDHRRRSWIPAGYRSGIRRDHQTRCEDAVRILRSYSA